MQPLGNGFLDAADLKNEYFFPMEIGYSEVSMMLQLIKQPSPEKMFHDHYAFYSSTSSFMEQHFKQFAHQVIQSGYLTQHDPFVVELGCNDGIMLKNFAEQGIRHLGIEPSLNVAQEANKRGVRTRSEFFSEELADTLVREEGQADAFLAANVMCHIPDIVGVVKGIKKLLKPTGVVMFEDPYLGDVIAKTSYDQIYDEHVFLFSALSIQYLFGLQDMELIDVQPQKTHGGSMRYVLAHKGAYPVKDEVKHLLEKERAQGLDRLVTFEKFRANVEQSRSNLVQLLTSLKAQGKKVAGYAATSKSTTVLNYCRIGPELLEYICDTTPIKQGKLSPGMHIPVVSYEAFKTNPPDYALLLAWNHAEEIMAKEKGFISSGGRWIVHVPEVNVLS
jgi:methylation protein EvaC